MARLSRRRFLATGALVALAGCTGGGDGDGQTDSLAATDTTATDEQSGGGETTEMASTTEESETTTDSTPTDGSETTTTDSGTETTAGGSGGDTVVVAVGPGGDFVFEPSDLEISASTSVRFEWDSAGHTVSPTSQPDGADWQGVDDTKDSDFSHEFTFDVAGTYEYICKPHQSLGMAGSVVVE
ncbi:plastocyanin/azurin family copper-binding protein [Haloarchaeobius sp. DFWS5]|uniref:plastocyanin/azurin family copper-binding protein n=1 Tax=Haloarchaeobius sp. DFWS5 TaxID=3446114 RepID=UPI003EB753E8